MAYLVENSSGITYLVSDDLTHATTIADSADISALSAAGIATLTLSEALISSIRVIG
jgi:hypothetical protein